MDRLTAGFAAACSSVGKHGANSASITGLRLSNWTGCGRHAEPMVLGDATPAWQARASEDTFCLRYDQ